MASSLGLKLSDMQMVLLATAVVNLASAIAIFTLVGIDEDPIKGDKGSVTIVTSKGFGRTETDKFFFKWLTPLPLLLLGSSQILQVFFWEKISASLGKGDVAGGINLAQLIYNCLSEPVMAYLAALVAGYDERDGGIYLTVLVLLAQVSRTVAHAVSSDGVARMWCIAAWGIGSLTYVAVVLPPWIETLDDRDILAGYPDVGLLFMPLVAFWWAVTWVLTAGHFRSHWLDAVDLDKLMLGLTTVYTQGFSWALLFGFIDQQPE